MAYVSRRFIHVMISILAFSGFTVIFLTTALGHQHQEKHPAEKVHIGISWWHNCRRQKLRVYQGEYFLKVMKRNNIDRKDVYGLLHSSSAVKRRLANLQPDQTLEICRQGNRLKTIAIALDENHHLLATKRHNTWRHWLESTQSKKKHIQITHFTIRHSFYREGKQAGLSAGMIAKVQYILRDRINFSRDIKAGDHFDIMLRHHADYTKPELEAIKYYHRGSSLMVMRYTNHHGQEGFYTKRGRSTLRSFDRVPIKYKRISSKFRRRRHHPILGYVRPHYGVDLTAPRGTPIYATSSGKVVFVGHQKGYGNTVIIRHGKRYKTLYAHMFHFAKHLRKGHYVKRHQVIGYVGMTGLATGPHCHYEFHINNKPFNPMTIKLPGSPSLVGKDRKEFIKRWRLMETKLVQA